MDQVPDYKKASNPGQIPGKSRSPRILVAPLDWGLGHATRCIPIIHQLIRAGCEVYLAGEGAQEKLLLAEFPHLPFLQLPGYRIRYSKTKAGLTWKMIRQGPRLLQAIRRENEWLKKMVQQHQLQAVISDNRYGLHHPGITSVFITHQLLIKSSAGKWTEKILQRRNYRYINRFDRCWVPDLQGALNLAGDLSHPETKPAIPLQYIGPLSRFKKPATEVSTQPGKLLILLSGPEPQRSLLEEKIVRDIGHYPGTAVIVRGLPGSASLIPSTNMIRVYNHLASEALQQEMQEAEYLISRSGYSTVMDLVTLNKKSILIPTPGQTEQEYLAARLAEKNIACCMNQDSFDLTTALKTAALFAYNLPDLPENELLQTALSELLQKLAGNQSVNPALG